MIWVLAALALMAFALKLYHDQRVYERAWRGERLAFDRYLERQSGRAPNV